MANICVIGTGYVGLVTGVCFADMGNNVRCVDINFERITNLNQHIVPFYEPGLEEMIEKNCLANRLSFTTSYPNALQDAEFIFICVGTPPKADGSTDMTQWLSSVEQIIETIDHSAIIINKSTLPVGTGSYLLEILNSRKKESLSFSVVSNPEFLKEGSAIQDSMQPDRVIIGADDLQSANKVGQLYKSLNCPIVISDLNTAELTKYASNAYLATRISFINEIANICEAVGADISLVTKGMGLDKRIGSRYLNPGLGWGGSCFPKDLKSLIHSATTNNINPQLLQAVEDVNARQRILIINKLVQSLGSLEGKVISVLGLAFKPNTDDIRDAPSLDIIRTLQKQGAIIQTYDPKASAIAQRLLTNVIFNEDAYAAANKADAILLVTEWSEFKDLDLTKLHEQMKGDLLVDGRNLFDPKKAREAGFAYIGMGRN
ncbi:MAG: UDP-glucose/GDP-mannose dehydrogenase family protein [Anaerolineaceae bacterium]|nr:UDP-glucose/GDP-mannose dehydrogenase family protein [Anaerolineaceae bacterium]